MFLVLDFSLACVSSLASANMLSRAWGMDRATLSDTKNKCIESTNKLHDKPIDTAVSSLSPVKTYTRDLEFELCP